MSISVQNITKVYGEQKALDNVSFSVSKGEIIGFLGPNGAGKSTMMKILTCYIPQSSGIAEVSDLDVEKDPIKIKAKVGYLPESNPLYTDMYVKEYLQFVAGSYGVKKDRVQELIQLTGLTPEQHKKIGQLSKGYRQRVGLAAALIHDPEVLILDEPTTGLDPNQLVEIRNLIKKLGKEKTVMLSTHIMQEVEQLCSRVIIINKGKIVADKPTHELTHASNQKVLLVEFDSSTNVNQLNSISEIMAVTTINDNRYEITTIDSKKARKALFDFAVNKGMTIVEITEKEQNLEAVFQSLTK